MGVRAPRLTGLEVVANAAHTGPMSTDSRGNAPAPGAETVPPEERQRLTDLYAAFNARELETVLSALAPDVSWPNGWEGGVVEGHDAVRDYWTRQWSQIDPTVTPTAFASIGNDRIAVTVAQTIRDRDGTLLGEGVVTHVYRFRDGLVTDMEIQA
jgi:nuclear transport factor 2 (NTF2) superfamily protein